MHLLKRPSENPQNRFFRRPFFSYGNLIPSPVRRGKVRMGGLRMYGNKGQEPPSPQPSPAGRERGWILVGKAHATVIPQTNTKNSAMGFSPTLGVARRCSVGFARESCCFFLDISLCFFSVGRNSRFISLRHSRAGGNPDSERPLQFLKISIASKT